MMKINYALNTIITITLLSFITILSSCASTGNTSEIIYKPITGKVIVEDLILLPPQANVIIQLLDITIVDEEPVEIVRQIIKNSQKIPLQFSLRFDSKEIFSFRTYGITVSIFSVDDVELYRSAEPVLVLTNGNPDTIELILDPVR